MFSGSRRVNNPTRALSPLESHPSCSLTRLLHASVQKPLQVRVRGRHTNLPRGSSPSSLLQRTVGAGSPWTSHRKSTVSSSMTTWLTGLRTNTGRSAGRARSFQIAHLAPRGKKRIKTDEELTVDDQLGRVAVPLPHHVRPHAHIHPGVALPGVRDHQLAAPHLENSSRDKREITGAPRMPAQC